MGQADVEGVITLTARGCLRCPCELDTRTTVAIGTHSDLAPGDRLVALAQYLQRSLLYGEAGGEAACVRLPVRRGAVGELNVGKYTPKIACGVVTDRLFDGGHRYEIDTDSQ